MGKLLIRDTFLQHNVKSKKGGFKFKIGHAVQGKTV